MAARTTATAPGHGLGHAEDQEPGHGHDALREGHHEQRLQARPSPSCPRWSKIRASCASLKGETGRSAARSRAPSRRRKKRSSRKSTRSKAAMAKPATVCWRAAVAAATAWFRALATSGRELALEAARPRLGARGGARAGSRARAGRARRAGGAGPSQAKKHEGALAEHGEGGAHRHQDGEVVTATTSEGGEAGAAAQHPREVALERGQQQGHAARHREDEQERAEDLEGQEQDDDERAASSGGKMSSRRRRSSSWAKHKPGHASRDHRRCGPAPDRSGGRGRTAGVDVRRRRRRRGPRRGPAGRELPRLQGLRRAGPWACAGTRGTASGRGRSRSRAPPAARGWPARGGSGRAGAAFSSFVILPQKTRW